MLCRDSIKYFLELCHVYPHIEMLVVSKYVNDGVIKQIHQLTGWINFGENRVEVLEEKADGLKDLSLTWHFIGHLQSRKIKRIVRCADHIQSVCREKELYLINQYAKAYGKVMRVWIQVNDGQQQGRSGVCSVKVQRLVKLAHSLEHVALQGLMLIPEKEDIRAYENVNQLRLMLDPSLKISAGMSDDHMIAIKNGSDMIRIGSALFI